MDIRYTTAHTTTHTTTHLIPEAVPDPALVPPTLLDQTGLAEGVQEGLVGVGGGDGAEGVSLEQHVPHVGQQQSVIPPPVVPLLYICICMMSIRFCCIHRSYTNQ